MWARNNHTSNDNNNNNDEEDIIDNNNTNNNNNEINQKVLERLALLEDQVKTLKKEIKKKDRRIRYSSSTKKVKSNESVSTADTDTEGLNMSDSIAEEDVFRVNDPTLNASADSIDFPNNRFNGGVGRDSDLTSSAHEGSFDDSDLKMAELAAHASEAVGSMSLDSRRSRSFRFNSFITRRINADDDYKALSEDTFTMMIMSRPGSKQWWYAFSIFLVQIALLTMILHDQYSYNYVTTPFDVPYKVDPVVRSGQLLAILLSLATQTDLVIAIITFIMLWSRRRISWTRVAEVASDSHTSIWTLRIALPLSCKFIEGVLVLVTTFVIVIQSDSMIELFKDFAAMQLISELDNMMFWMALHGYAGVNLMEGARKAQKVRIKDDVVKSYCGIPLRTLVLVIVFCCMLSCWSYIAVGQISGNFFYLKFPHCTISKYKIASMKDGVCDGGAQNTIECGFDDGDCLAFNIAYPGCRVVETQMIGDGECNSEFNLPECGFDGGDCCPVMEDDRLGDGYCDGYVFNTEICGFDDGDCLEFNEKYPMCCGLENYTLNELWNEYSRLEHVFALGDGICDNVPIYNGPECGYDGGDCEECFHHFEEQLKKDEFHNRYFDFFGDGKCDAKSPLNIEICGYDGRDCHQCMTDELEADTLQAFNISKLGDGICDGGPFMSYYCYYDGGDCLDYVDEYPDCDAEFPALIGNNECNLEYDYEECGFDGGDCDKFKEQYNLYDCDVDNKELIGNGECDAEFLSEECAWDGGDCSNCTAGDKTMMIAYIGDGLCDGEKYMTEECDYDGGDCDRCAAKDIYKVGDGICDEELNTLGCGFDGGDCVGDFGGDNETSSKIGGGNIFGGFGSVFDGVSYTQQAKKKWLGE